MRYTVQRQLIAAVHDNHKLYCLGDKMLPVQTLAPINNLTSNLTKRNRHHISYPEKQQKINLKYVNNNSQQIGFFSL